MPARPHLSKSPQPTHPGWVNGLAHKRKVGMVVVGIALAHIAVMALVAHGLHPKARTSTTPPSDWQATASAATPAPLKTSLQAQLLPPSAWAQSGSVNPPTLEPNPQATTVNATTPPASTQAHTTQTQPQVANLPPQPHTPGHQATGSTVTAGFLPGLSLTALEAEPNAEPEAEAAPPAPTPHCPSTSQAPNADPCPRAAPLATHAQTGHQNQ